MIDLRIIIATTITLILLSLNIEKFTLSYTLMLISIILITVATISKLINNNYKIIIFDTSMMIVMITISLKFLGIPSTIAIILTYLAISLIETNTQGPPTTRPIESAITLTTALLLLKYEPHQIILIIILTMLPYVTNAIRRGTEDNHREKEREVKNFVDLAAKLSSLARN